MICEKCGKVYGNCNSCPYDVETCITIEGEIFLMKDALDLINRQKAEIERLEQDNKEYHEANLVIAYQRNERDKEIKALHRQLNGLHFMEQQAKSEVIKEFAERLKRKCIIDRGYEILQEDDIDNLVKEMTEVEDDG